MSFLVLWLSKLVYCPFSSFCPQQSNDILVSCAQICLAHFQFLIFSPRFPPFSILPPPLLLFLFSFLSLHSFSSFLSSSFYFPPSSLSLPPFFLHLPSPSSSSMFSKGGLGRAFDSAAKDISKSISYNPLVIVQIWYIYLITTAWRREERRRGRRGEREREKERVVALWKIVVILSCQMILPCVQNFTFVYS